MKKPITLDELKGLVTEGELLEIPSPARRGDTITVRVIPQDITEIMRKATPDSLSTTITSTVQEMFEEKDGVSQDAVLAEVLANTEIDESDTVDRMIPAMNAIVDACLIEPTPQNFIDLGVPLRMDQKMVIFNWAMGDTMAMLGFRQGEEAPQDANSELEDLGSTAE